MKQAKQLSNTSHCARPTAAPEAATVVAEPTPSTVAHVPPTPRKSLALVQLLGDAQSVDIDHNGHVYRLQLTKAGKLILTK